MIIKDKHGNIHKRVSRLKPVTFLNMVLFKLMLFYIIQFRTLFTLLGLISNK
jgi:hypothetical protein